MTEAREKVFQKIATERDHPREEGRLLSRRNVLRVGAATAALVTGGVALKGVAELSRAMHNEMFEARLRNGHGWVARHISIAPSVPLRSSLVVPTPGQEPNVEAGPGHGWIILDNALIRKGNRNVAPAEENRFADINYHLRLGEAWAVLKYKGFWVAANLWAIVDEALEADPAAKNDLDLVYGEIRQIRDDEFELIPAPDSRGNQRPISLSVDVN